MFFNACPFSLFLSPLPLVPPYFSRSSIYGLSSSNSTFTHQSRQLGENGCLRLRSRLSLLLRPGRFRLLLCGYRYVPLELTEPLIPRTFAVWFFFFSRSSRSFRSFLQLFLLPGDLFPPHFLDGDHSSGYSWPQ